MCGPDFCSMRLYSKTEGIKTFNEEKRNIEIKHRLLTKEMAKRLANRKYIAEEKIV